MRNNHQLFDLNPGLSPRHPSFVATLFSGAVLLQVIFQIDFWVALPIIILTTGIYSCLGGLKAIAYTEVFQMFIFTLGGLTASIYTLHQVGGLKELFSFFNTFEGMASSSSQQIHHLREFPHVIRGINSEFSWTVKGEVDGDIQNKNKNLGADVHRCFFFVYI